MYLVYFEEEKNIDDSGFCANVFHKQEVNIFVFFFIYSTPRVRISCLCTEERIDIVHSVTSIHRFKIMSKDCQYLINNKLFEINILIVQEALQALNFMASGGGLHHPLLPPPNHSPLGLGPHPFSPMSVHNSNKGPSTPTYSGEY